MTALITGRGLADRVAAGGEPVGLTTDPRRVERMLANLIGNAVEHSGRDVVVRTGAGGAHGYVEVADADPGISPEHLPRVFGRFVNAGSARAGAGSGLGLAIARRTPGSWTGTSACPATCSAVLCSGGSCRSGRPVM
ncbi:MAG TPA: ATP-binding protein [Streptosporangiaceae bacterium]|nr:ATP-binding protein [Streptosporangiaceae bacterium]